MSEDTSEWPKRPQIVPRAARREIPPPKTKARLKVGRQKVSRRQFLKASAAAAAIGMFGRGATETAIDVKEGVEKSVRAFKSLPKFFHQEQGAVQFERVSEVTSTSKEPQTEFLLVFHNLPEKEKLQAVTLVRQMHGVICQNPEYQSGSLFEVTRKYEEQIKQAGVNAGINPNLALGIIFVENGGGEAIINANSGAAGVAQLMPETAVRYGLRVDSAVDERLEPQKAISAMCQYLKDLKSEFLDDGLAVWAYHAGEGNVYSALRAYLKDVDGVDFGDVVESLDASIAQKYRKLVKEKNLTVHQVLQNRRVQREVLSQLEDETELYVYKVIAASQLYKINKQAFG